MFLKEHVDFLRSVIKRPADSTTGTTSGQIDTTGGQTSTRSGQTSTTNGQTNGQASTTNGKTSTTSGETSIRVEKRVPGVLRVVKRVL